MDIGNDLAAGDHRHGLCECDFTKWLLIGCSLLVSYAVFATVLYLLGLDEDDRLVANALWSRLRRSVPLVREFNFD